MIDLLSHLQLLDQAFMSLCLGTNSSLLLEDLFVSHTCAQPCPTQPSFLLCKTWTLHHAQAQLISALSLPLNQFFVINFCPLLFTLGSVLFTFVSPKPVLPHVRCSAQIYWINDWTNEYTKILPFVISSELLAMLLYCYLFGRCNI